MRTKLKVGLLRLWVVFAFGYFCYTVDSFQKAIAQAEGVSPDYVATAERMFHDAFHIPIVAELVFGVPLAGLVFVLLLNWAISAFISN